MLIALRKHRYEPRGGGVRLQNVRLNRVERRQPIVALHPNRTLKHAMPLRMRNIVFQRMRESSGRP